MSKENNNRVELVKGEKAAERVFNDGKTFDEMTEIEKTNIENENNDLDALLEEEYDEEDANEDENIEKKR